MRQTNSLYVSITYCYVKGGSRDLGTSRPKPAFENLTPSSRPGTQPPVFVRPFPAMSLLITNGRVITASDDYVADVYCENGAITAVGRDLPAHRYQAERTIDARGQYVLPG